MFARTQFRTEDEDAGISISDLCGAILTWAVLQQRPVTVGGAAVTFNTSAEVIREAISKTQWMYIAGDDERIELEGD